MKRMWNGRGRLGRIAKQSKMPRIEVVEWKLLMGEREGCERTEEALLSSLRRISRALIG